MSFVQISLKDLPASPALESHIRKRTDKLSRFSRHINSCRVVVELPKKHQHQGKLYSVHIDITVTGKELAVTRKYDKDVYIAVREAFDAVERQLEEHSQKRHERSPRPYMNGKQQGHIARILHREGYGFIEGEDGNEYYFAMAAVSYPKFEQLLVGDSVEYSISQELASGLQAQHIMRQEV